MYLEKYAAEATKQMERVLTKTRDADYIEIPPVWQAKSAYAAFRTPAKP
jgi:hypothetical protein